MPDEDDSYLEWYIGEYYLFKTVFTVFRLQGRPGWYQVSGFDGEQNTKVCAFTAEADPVWSKAWQGRQSHRNEIVAQARRVIKQATK